VYGVGNEEMHMFALQHPGWDAVKRGREWWSKTRRLKVTEGGGEIAHFSPRRYVNNLQAKGSKGERRGGAKQKEDKETNRKRKMVLRNGQSTGRQKLVTT